MSRKKKNKKSRIKKPYSIETILLATAVIQLITAILALIRLKIIFNIGIIVADSIMIYLLIKRIKEGTWYEEELKRSPPRGGHDAAGDG